MTYSEIWGSLETAAADSGGLPGTKVVRDLGGKAIRGFLGLALPERRRQLLIQVPAGEHISERDLPHWHGLEVATFEGDVADIHQGRFCILGERSGENGGVYAAVMEDLWSHIAGLKGWPEASAELQRRLARWSDFFAEIGVRGLSLSAQRGLYGELWFLAEHLMRGVAPSPSIAAWVGQRHAHQDFQLTQAAIEVKTSIAKQLVQIRIASERQLDDRGLPALYLAVLLLTELEAGGESLPERVRKVRGMATAAGLGMELDDKLLEAGYLDEQAGLYNRGYVVRSFHAFIVRDGFPRVLEEDLPDGVGDVSYSIDLALAKSFEVPTAPTSWWTPAC
jgi:hypothetical protein